MSAFVNNVRNDVLGSIRAMARYVFSIAGPVLRAASDACANADVVVHSFFFTTFAHSLARARNIPDLSVQLVPLFIPTRAYPMIALPTLPPGSVSYFTHWLTARVFQRAMHVVSNT